MVLHTATLLTSSRGAAARRTEMEKTGTHPETCLSELLGEWQVYRGSKRNPGELKAVTT